jgi:hypothetical protein
MAPTPFREHGYDVFDKELFCKMSPIGKKPGKSFVPAIVELYLGPIENMDQICKIYLVATTSLHS